MSSAFQVRRTDTLQLIKPDFSLHSLILALGNPRVDLLSLDIEGAEYLVLQTLPWEKVSFDIC